MAPDVDTSSAPRVDDFLKELGELSKKYGIWIAGCGDCGSPWLEEPTGPAMNNYLMPSEDYESYSVGG